MNIVEAFRHINQNIKTKFKSYIHFIVFVAIVISAFMMIIQSGNLMNSVIKDNMDIIGSKTLNITSVTPGNSEKFFLTIDDVNLLKTEQKTDVSSVYGLTQSLGQAKAGNQSAPCIIKGVTPEITQFLPIVILEGGRFIVSDDLSGVKNSCVVNQNFAEKYFKKYDIVGENISLKLENGNTENYQVVGVMKNDMAYNTNPFRQDCFSEIYIPLTSAANFFENKSLSYMEVKIKNSSSVGDMAERLTRVLELKHGDGTSFAVRKNVHAIYAQGQLYNITDLVISVIGIILVVSGILGVQNFMNLLIRLRAHEIAVRKVLGASDRDLWIQFQVESIVITGFGGIAGIILGILFGNIQYLIAGYGSIISVGSIFITILVILFLGVAGGYFPARRSALVEIIPNMRR